MEINKDYIGVVSELANKKMSYTQVLIENKHKGLISILNDMIDNPNKTVLDLQTHFTKEFRQADHQEFYNFCYPYAYNSSYIGGIHYPKIYSYDEYKTAISDYKISLQSRNVQGNIELMVKTEICNKKKSFYNQVNRYISAYYFSKKLLELKSNPANKMFSSEAIGWTNYQYKVNDDIIVTVKSNFGYGGSSYFFVNLTYKGIDILPYSDSVKYYHAKMVDLIRYTRLYCTERKSWNIALDFVTETVNDAVQDEASFVQKWIVNEVEEMMRNLETLARDPKYIFDMAMKNTDVKGLSSVRIISNSEIKLFKIYQRESLIAFQAEKISNSLLLLEKLKALAPIYSKVTESIDRIIEINTDLFPQFQKAISDIEKEIDKRTKDLDNDEEKKESLEVKNKEHFDKIQEIMEESLENNTFTYEHKVREKYIEENPSFGIDYKEIQNLIVSINKKRNDIYYRKAFVTSLRKCMDLMNSVLDLAA